VENTPGRLVLAGTPIGNTEDASPALLRALAEADVIAAEDTRRFHGLLGRLGVTTSARVVSYFDGNETARAEELIAALAEGRTVVVVSDAGMPTVSDPGFRVMAAAVAAGFPVRVVPGPSAVLVALALSGLPTDRFCFEGFLPRKGGERRRRLADLATESRTMVFFEAPHRLSEFLTDAVAAFGPTRQAAVSRELTKTYEETRRGTLAEVTEWAAGGVRGEITVVVAGAAPLALSVADALPVVAERVAAGEPFSAAVAAVAAESGLPRKALYQAALAARSEHS
jgi:16S rRNA (cytidine1402-2'-O)-methyltransferase